MVIFLVVVAVVAFIMLFVMFKNYRTVMTSHMKESHPRLRIVTSWLLLIIMISSLVGAG